MRSCVREVACFSLLSLVCVAPATAQFKPKLSKLNPLAKKESAATPRTPAFNDRVLEITDERVSALIKGYAAEAREVEAGEKRFAEARAAYEEQNRAHPARLAEYEKGHKAWAACQDQVVKPAQVKAEADMQRSQDEVTGGDQAAFERKMEDLKRRIETAKAEGNMAEVMRLADSLQQSVGMKSAVAANQSSAELQAAHEKCGDEPVRPEPPTAPYQGEPDLDGPGSKAAGLTQDQYAILKERVEYAVTEDCDVRVTASNWAFAEGELEVLKRRAEEICQARAPVRQRGH